MTTHEGAAGAPYRACRRLRPFSPVNESGHRSTRARPVAVPPLITTPARAWRSRVLRRTNSLWLWLSPLALFNQLLGLRKESRHSAPRATTVQVVPQRDRQERIQRNAQTFRISLTFSLQRRLDACRGCHWRQSGVTVAPDPLYGLLELRQARSLRSPARHTASMYECARSSQRTMR